MKRLLITTTLLLSMAIQGFAQPGPIRMHLEEVVKDAVERQRIKGGHFYAKSPIERRWIAAWIQSNPNLRLVDNDDQPRWYDFGRPRAPRGFRFDIVTGSDVGAITMLNKKLRAAMRRALLSPVAVPVGNLDDTVILCLVEKEPYNADKFDRWLRQQCSVTIPWCRRYADGTVSFAFVAKEQEDTFRRHNLNDLLDNFLYSTLRPLAPILADFSWHSRTNFIFETQGVRLSDKGFDTNMAEGIECLWVKHYDKLYLWESGLLRGVFSLHNLPHLNDTWSGIKKTTKNLRSLPFSEKEFRTMLSRCEDSIFTLHQTRLAASGIPDTLLLAHYFTVFGKYDTPHSLDIENAIFTLAKTDLAWAAYYLHIYDPIYAHRWNEIDDLSFAIVHRDLSHAQTYKNLFPKGKHTAEADEILTLEKACRAYDRDIYLNLYPNGTYLQRFDQYMDSEEQRLSFAANQIYNHSSLHDIEETLHFAVYPYINHFPNGPHLDQVNEAYYYGTALQKKTASIYTSRYPLRTPRTTRLLRLISLQGEQNNPENDLQQYKKQLHWIHQQILSQPFSNFFTLTALDNGSYHLSSLHISLPASLKKRRSCAYERPMATLVTFDRSSNSFFIDDGATRRYSSDSPFLTLKKYLSDGYNEGRGILYEAEQWLLNSCPDIPVNP